MKLNLGCFDKKLPDFINVDIREDVNPDIVDNIFQLESFTSNTADLIYCCHALEHTARPLEVLRVWKDILKPGGVLRLSVPNIEEYMKLYMYTGDLSLLHTALWGSQYHEYDYHKHGWDFSTLKQDLEAVGFVIVRWWDWTQTHPHNYIDDYSSAYWPYRKMEFKNGKITHVEGQLMSLNVEATKPE
jgi:predicted SAM-dependent methyltransferase